MSKFSDLRKTLSQCDVCLYKDSRRYAPLFAPSVELERIELSTILKALAIADEMQEISRVLMEVSQTNDIPRDNWRRKIAAEALEKLKKARGE